MVQRSTPTRFWDCFDGMAEDSQCSGMESIFASATDVARANRGKRPSRERYFRRAYAEVLTRGMGYVIRKCGNQDFNVNRELNADGVTRNKFKQAESKVCMWEISRARVHLMSDGVARGITETLNEWTDPNLRPNVISEAIPDFPNSSCRLISFYSTQTLYWLLYAPRVEVQRKIWGV